MRNFAANNNIIVLMPSSVCQDMTGPGPHDNPWDDYEGIDDEHWLTRDGLYPQAIMAMICRLTSCGFDNECPVAEGECVDDDIRDGDRIGDADGDYCDAYFEDLDWCGGYDTDVFNSGVMCCACNGGSTGGADE